VSNRQNKPTIGALSFMLRHPELWPADFRWSYTCCATCAMGLAQRMWPHHIQSTDPDSVGRAIGLSEHDAAEIFTNAGPGLLRSSASIKPEQIADMLDAVA